MHDVWFYSVLIEEKTLSSFITCTAVYLLFSVNAPALSTSTKSCFTHTFLLMNFDPSTSRCPCLLFVPCVLSCAGVSGHYYTTACYSCSGYVRARWSGPAGQVEARNGSPAKPASSIRSPLDVALVHCTTQRYCAAWGNRQWQIYPNPAVSVGLWSYQGCDRVHPTPKSCSDIARQSRCV